MGTPNTDGIDTSRHQTLSITSKFPPLTFAMHKVSEGRSWGDPELREFATMYRNSPQIKHVGFYHYMRSDTPAGDQALNFINKFEKVCGYLLPGEFIVLDWERDSAGGIAKVSEVEAWCTVIGEWLKAKGYKDAHNRIGVYSAPWVTGFSTWRKRNPTKALFLANYRTNRLLPFNGWSESAKWNASVWQWTSSGVVGGIANRVDVNHVFNWSWFRWLETA